MAQGRRGAEAGEQPTQPYDTAVRFALPDADLRTATGAQNVTPLFLNAHKILICFRGF